MAIISILKWMSSACNDNAILNKGAITIMQIKEVAKWSNRENL